MGEILRLIVRSRFAAPLTKGIFGIQRFADDFFELNPLPRGRYGVGTFRFDQRTMWVVIVGWVLVVVVTLLVRRLVRSPWGRVIRAIREDEDAARSLGKNVFAYKMQSLMIGGSIGALAGMYLAIDQQNVTPDAYTFPAHYAFTIEIMGGPAPMGAGGGIDPVWFLFEILDGLMTGAMAEGWFGTLLESTDIGPIRRALRYRADVADGLTGRRAVRSREEPHRWSMTDTLARIAATPGIAKRSTRSCGSSPASVFRRNQRRRREPPEITGHHHRRSAPTEPARPRSSTSDGFDRPQGGEWHPTVGLLVGIPSFRIAHNGAWCAPSS
jgi:hypothetical protein